MHFYTLFAAVAIYVAFIAQAVHSYPIPARLEATDIQARDALKVPLADFAVRYNQPILSEDIVTRDWKTQAKKYLPWTKKDAPPKHGPLQITVKTEVMQHHDTLPHQHVQHPHIPKVDGKYHRVQMPYGSGPRPMPQKQHYGIAITTDQPAIARPEPVIHHGGANIWKPLPAIPHGNP